MTDEVLGAFGAKIHKLELIPSSGGVFEVELNGEPIFSKKDTGRFPETGEVVAELHKRME